MKIFLDDVRDTPKGWWRTFTVDSTISLLMANPGKVKILSLDNDLGEGQLEGYKVLDHLDYLVFLGEHQYLPEKIVIHSANPVARDRMSVVINKLYNK